MRHLGLIALAASGAAQLGAAPALAGDDYGYGDYRYGYSWGYGHYEHLRRDGNVAYNAYNSYDGYRRHRGYWERPSDRWNGYRCEWTTGCGYYPRHRYYGHAYAWGETPRWWREGDDGYGRGVNGDYVWSSPRWRGDCGCW